MEDLDTLDKAVGFDIGSQYVPMAQTMGRLVVVLLVAMMVLRLVRRAIRRVDDNRFRDRRLQLLAIVPTLYVALYGNHWCLCWLYRRRHEGHKGLTNFQTRATRSTKTHSP